MKTNRDSESMLPVKVCFVAPHLAAYVRGEPPVQIGGAEIQQAILADLFAEAGYSVSVICEDYKPLVDEAVGPISLYKSYDPSSGVRVLRFVHPKITGLWRALCRADADVYYVRTASYVTAVVAEFCRINSKRWLYAGAHDTDFTPGSELVELTRDRLLFRYGLRRADAIICQSDTQARILQANYGRRCIVAHNLMDEFYRSGSYRVQGPVVWVATLRSWKRPDWFIELVAKYPDRQFVMAGGAAAENLPLFRKLEKMASKYPNLRFLGAISPTDAAKLIAGASLFVNTSVHEGFPNTFLQAWSAGVPTLSTVDPNSAIVQNALGWVAKDKQSFFAAADRYFVGSVTFDQEQIGEYFNSHHSRTAFGQYERLIGSMGFAVNCANLENEN